MNKQTELLSCPFCGHDPTISPEGSQYEISCDNCGQASASVQISDYMTLDERMTDVISSPTWLHADEFLERARVVCFEYWNMRATNG